MRLLIAGSLVRAQYEEQGQGDGQALGMTEKLDCRKPVNPQSISKAILTHVAQVLCYYCSQEFIYFKT